MTTNELAAIFEEWKRRYDEDPKGFWAYQEFVDSPPQSYGEAAARYFQFLIDDMTSDGVK